MKIKQLLAASIAGGFAIAPIAAVGAPGIAAADTSSATATALDVRLLGGRVVSTGTATADFDGTTERTTNTIPRVVAIAGQPILSVGVAIQHPRAHTDSTSASCAGVVGRDGTVQLGQDGRCDLERVTQGANLALLGDTLRLRADGVLAACYAFATPTPGGRTTLVDAKLVLAGRTIELPVDPAPNTVVEVPGIARVVLNRQQTIPGNGIDITAVSVEALPGLGLAGIDIGHVTCGPNARTRSVPAIPAGAIPGAGMTLIGLGAVAVVRKRRGEARRLATATA